MKLVSYQNMLWTIFENNPPPWCL